MPRKPLDEEAVEDRVLAAANGGPGAHRAAARDFEAWATEPHPDDEISRAHLLLAAGGQWSLAGDHAMSVRAYRGAVALGEPCEPDARAYLLSALLQQGDSVGAGEVAAALWAARPRDPWTYQVVGEAFEAVGDLASAHRWMTSGLVRLVRRDDVEVWEVASLMQVRRRVRRAMGEPEDDYDTAAEAARKALIRRMTMSAESPYGVTDVDDDAAANHGRSRNDPCACGSGRKVKRCCGSPGPVAVMSTHGGDTYIDLV